MLEKYTPFFDQLLQEGALSPVSYFNPIKQLCTKFYKKNKDKSNTKKICDSLTSILSKYKIKFIMNMVIADDPDFYIKLGINGANVMFDKYVTIVIHCNELIEKSFKDEHTFNKFLDAFYIVVKHELIHRQQYLRMQSDELVSQIGHSKKFTTQIDYISDKHEIMAFAWQAVEYFKLRGVSKQNILSVLKEPKKYFRYDNSIFAAYWLAHEKGLITDDTINLFYKYAYYYANEE
jgi:hypothetical protein